MVNVFMPLIALSNLSRAVLSRACSITFRFVGVETWRSEDWRHCYSLLSSSITPRPVS